jgi:hypothetical protein
MVRRISRNSLIVAILGRIGYSSPLPITKISSGQER